ncbi:GntR family transcriptional regulator, partial [Rhizobium sp.]
MRKPELSTPDLTARIEAMIIAGSLAPGDRLPAERQLAAEMGASRS